MSTPILATKLYIPSPRSKIVSRPRLVERLDEGHCQSRASGRKITLISAPAGFGKTTLLIEWIAGCDRLVAWLSLDEGDNDPTRFLAYLIAALQTVAANIGERLLGAIQSPQPPPFEPVLTALLNEIAAVREDFILVLDDYHVIDSRPIDQALAFLLERLPPQMQIVIATREDPGLPLARLRARGHLTELRAADLRFTPGEAAEFLNRVMGLNLSAEEITVLETRTEGWIAGLQLAALALQGHLAMGTASAQGLQDAASFIQSFTGSHRFVLDYLVEEVLQQQDTLIQEFLLRTSILDRMCGSLCDSLLYDSPASGQMTLEYLERANLFIVPLDNERRWYRYHHLFADLLRQRLQQQSSQQAHPTSTGDADKLVTALHIRASQWYEDNGLELEAFQHAAAANDIDRAERLIEGRGIPIHFSGAAAAVLAWLESLPPEVMESRPSLWWRYASILLINGQTTGVEEKLQAAEASLSASTSLEAGVQGAAADEQTRNLVGQIAAARATLALTRYDPEAMLAQSLRALEYLHPTSLFTRANAYWTMGYAYFFQGDRVAARRALTEAISLSQAARAAFTTILATIGLGNVQEADNQLHPAAETYRRVLQLAGDQPLQIINEAHLGLARILYQWNDLDAAEQYAQQSLRLARQYDQVIDRFLISEVFLALLKLARGDAPGAATSLDRASQAARQRNFVHRIPEIAAAQALVLLRQGNLEAAANLAQAHLLPLILARVHLAQGNASAALETLDSLRRQVEAKGWHDELLKVMVLQAVAYQAGGDQDRAVQALGEALTLAEPGGYIRIFVDEGPPMAQLLSEAAGQETRPGYISKLLAAFDEEERKPTGEPFFRKTESPSAQPMIEPLSPRELEVLRLIAQGLSNHKISERLFLALDTVKGHNRKIYDKLQVHSRTEAVARGRQLGLL